MWLAQVTPAEWGGWMLLWPTAPQPTMTQPWWQQLELQERPDPRATPLPNRRVLHSPSVAALGLWVAYETWPSIGWHHPFGINWFKYRLGLPTLQCIVGSCDWWEFPPFRRGHWQCPCRARTAGKLPTVRAVQGDCERVYPLCQITRDNWGQFQEDFVIHRYLWLCRL